jgi:hypothetical protein
LAKILKFDVWLSFFFIGPPLSNLALTFLGGGDVDMAFRFFMGNPLAVNATKKLAEAAPLLSLRP